MIPQYCKLRIPTAHDFRVIRGVQVHNERNFPQARHDSGINVPFLLNEHGDLSFSSHNNRVHIVSLVKKNKKFIGQKKKIQDIQVKACKKPLLWSSNYDRENNDYIYEHFTSALF